MNTAEQIKAAEELVSAECIWCKAGLDKVREESPSGIVTWTHYNKTGWPLKCKHKGRMHNLFFDSDGNILAAGVATGGYREVAIQRVQNGNLTTAIYHLSKFYAPADWTIERVREEAQIQFKVRLLTPDSETR